MLHSILNLSTCFFGAPFLIISLTSLFLILLESTMSKRRNINSYNLKINNIIGKGFSFNFFSKVMIVYLSFLILANLCCKSYIFNNNLLELNLTNFSLQNTLIISLFILTISFFNLNLRTISYKSYLNLTLCLLVLLVPCIYIYNSFITLFFIIEILSISTFLFILNSLTPISSLNKKKELSNILGNTNYRKLNSNYRYSIFIYYWLSFFFSIFFFIFISYISYQLNFIEVSSIVSFYTHSFLYSNHTNNNMYILLLIIFLILIILKFGLPPLHLQKITIYKGLPINLSLLYSIIVIVSYFFIFANLFYILPSINISSKVIFKLTLIISIPFVLIVLFKELNIKAFFGYSSILNIAILFLLILN